MLNEKEFDILKIIEGSNENLSQRSIAKEAGYSIGTVNSTYALLEEKGLIADGQITAEGLKALEPYRVKRIVFIAAGFGTRLVPITLNTPKPLVRVKGVRIIDTMLDAAVAAGIEEIIIGTGHCNEWYDDLAKKYHIIKTITRGVTILVASNLNRFVIRHRSKTVRPDRSYRIGNK